MCIRHHPDLEGDGLLFKVTCTEKTGKYRLERQGMLHLCDFSEQISDLSADEGAECDRKDVI